jgi:cell division protease FtsH
MSDDLGPLTLGQKSGEVFLGRDFSSHPDYSEQVAFEIDNEVRRLIDEAHDMALSILTEHRESLDRWADILIEKETIDKAQVEELFASVRKRPQRDPEQRSAGLAVSRTAVRQQSTSKGPTGLRG